MARAARTFAGVLKPSGEYSAKSCRNFMKKDVRRILFGTVAGFALVCCGVTYTRSMAQKRRVTRVQIVFSRWKPNAKFPLEQKRVWNREQAQIVFEALEIAKGSRCNLCMSPDNSNMAYMRIFLAQGGSFEHDLNLNNGQVSPYDNGCLYYLTPQSLAYFRALLAKTSATPQ